ncbi:MAG: ABC transporter substrate-binding protein [Betaproteobacteria bacterium]
MRRRDFLALAGIAGIAPGALAQPGRPPRIGYLLLQPMSTAPSRERLAFLEGLRVLGYEPGKSVVLIYRSAENAPEFLDDMARDLVAGGVDVIVTAGSEATLSAMRATRRIPIVMMAVGDPVGIGAVKAIARPGSNVTGMSFLSSDLTPKRIQLATEVLPRAKRIVVAWDSRNANARAEAGTAQASLGAIGLQAEMVPIADELDIDDALMNIAARRADAFYLAFEGGLVAGNRTRFAGFALRQRLALISGWSGVTEAGGLLSYAPDFPGMFRSSAMHVHRVLRGENPAAIPIEMPTRIELVINAGTAKSLGIVLPQSILLRADLVID